MPSKKCPKCGKIVTSSSIPGFCAWGGCSLKEQPLCDICEIYKTSGNKPLFGSKCPKLNTGRGEDKTLETETKQSDLPLSGADALLAELKKQREEREKTPLQLNMFKI